MKEKFSIYKLHFTSPLHLGDARDDYSISLKSIASDAMYAALTACLAKLGYYNGIAGQARNDGFDSDLGFNISSLFPFYQKDKNSEAVYFFPKPRKSVELNLQKTTEEIDRKKFKKVDWLDLEFFIKYLSSGSVDINLSDIKSNYLTTKEIDRDFISSAVSPRVKVPRDYAVEQDATPFYMDRIYFKDYSGLYFMMKGETNLLRSALELLQNEGIGTDRNVGNGFFTVSEDKIELDLPDKCETDYTLSLSMFIPESKQQLDEMLSGEKVGYDFVRRGGWITTPPFNTYRKNAIYAFTHGSVFSMKMTENVVVEGKIVDLKPEIEFEQGKIDHPIWRNGRSFFIPIVV
jgi:CRISPR-associated protein Csm4